MFYHFNFFLFPQVLRSSSQETYFYETEISKVLYEINKNFRNHKIDFDNYKKLIPHFL